MSPYRYSAPKHIHQYKPVLRPPLELPGAPRTYRSVSVCEVCGDIKDETVRKRGSPEVTLVLILLTMLLLAALFLSGQGIER